jgi:hypothetical protein
VSFDRKVDWNVCASPTVQRHPHFEIPGQNKKQIREKQINNQESERTPPHWNGQHHPIIVSLG